MFGTPNKIAADASLLSGYNGRHMNLEPALCSGIILCERIIREEGTGKYTLIGCFNNFNARSFPLTTFTFYALAMITNFKGRFESIDVALRIEQPRTGHVLFSSAGNVKLKEGVTLEGTEILEIPFQISPFMLPSAGVYSFVILVNNEQLGKRAFTATAIATGTPQIGEGG